jgi:hypothetical protein
MCQERPNPHELELDAMGGVGDALLLIAEDEDAVSRVLKWATAKFLNDPQKRRLILQGSLVRTAADYPLREVS